ncbi:hypothetical protein VNI00_016653 [Paramarasmius palmivorus]|uniref:Uncharacterized protein n=1 Tax=Paramarasmius palmivorus TaxID=297713 RepID=A0AAW0BB06_9AGAR
MAGFAFSPTLTYYPDNMIWNSCATLILAACATAFSLAPFPTTITQGIPFTVTWIREPEETQSFMIIKSAVGVPPVSSPRYFLVTATAGQTEGTVLVSFPTNTYAFVLDAVQIDGNGNPLSTFYTGTQTLAVIATGEIASQFVPTSVTTTGSSSVTPISVLSGLPSPTSSQSFSSTPANRKPVGAIVGGAVGGICLSLFLSLVGLYLLRRRRKQKQIAQLTNAQDLYRSSEITPFTERRSSKRILSNSHVKSIPEPTSSLHTGAGVDNTSIRESSRNDFDTTIHSRTSRPGHRPPTDFDGSIPSSEIAEMVRALYQRMWNPERDERPPAYEARV